MRSTPFLADFVLTEQNEPVSRRHLIPKNRPQPREPMHATTCLALLRRAVSS
jgi:hypothetical protein